MLVLTRRIGEELIIGDDIVVRLLDTSRGEARIGIEAPRHVRVMRRELVEQEGQS